MVTLDTIRKALAASDPYKEMDRLVRGEMASGRKVKEVFDAIAPLTDSVLDTPGLSKHGEEAFLGTIDALTGNCDPDQWYEDPPNTALPTEEEIAKLPRWARVAFAARCARRVFPLVTHYWPEIPQRRLAALDRAVRVAERLVPFNAADEFTRAGASVTVVANSTRASGAVATIAAAARVGEITDIRESVGRVADAAIVAADATDLNIVPIIRRDFDHLANVAQWQHWTDDTPVPPEVFGPLWPEGPPQGWPADSDVPRRADLPVELLSAARVLERMTEDETVNLFNAINSYYIARTGHRLTLEHLRTMIAAGKPVEV